MGFQPGTLYFSRDSSHFAVIPKAFGRGAVCKETLQLLSIIMSGSQLDASNVPSTERDR
jgi:hypothetical protein